MDAGTNITPEQLEHSRKALASFAADVAAGKLTGRLVIDRTKNQLDYRRLAWYETIIPKLFGKGSPSLREIVDFCCQFQKHGLVVPELKDKAEKVRFKPLLFLFGGGKISQTALDRLGWVQSQRTRDLEAARSNLDQLEKIGPTPKELAMLGLAKETKLALFLVASEKNNLALTRSLIASMTPEDLRETIDHPQVQLEMKSEQQGKKVAAVKKVVAFERGDTMMHAIARLGRTDLAREIFKRYPFQATSLVVTENQDHVRALDVATGEIKGLFRKVSMIAEKPPSEVIPQKPGTGPLAQIKEAFQSKDKARINAALADPELANYVDENGQNILHFLCREGKTELVQKVIDRFPKGKAFTGDNESSTPLHIACFQGHLDIVKSLMRKSDNPAEQLNLKDENGRTPLFYACSEGKNDVVMALLKNESVNGMDIDSNLKKSPLDIAASKGNLPLVRALIDKGLGLFASDALKNSVLHTACASGQADVVELLLKQPIAWGENDEGKTPRHVAIESTNPKIIAMFLEKYPYQSAWEFSDAKGRTPLHLACERPGRQANIKALLDKFPKLPKDTKDQAGKTALHYVCAIKDLATVHELATILGSKVEDFLVRDKNGAIPFDYVEDSRIQDYLKLNVPGLEAALLKQKELKT